MDPGQIAELTRWARNLQENGENEEARAAARAILLLADEIERLRGEPEGSGRGASREEGASEDEEPPGPEPPAAGGVRGWLRRAFTANPR